MKTIIILFAVCAIFFASEANNAFSQQANTCQEHTICVHPGDTLTYSMTLRDVNSTENYNFKNMVDSDNIQVLQNQDESNVKQNATLILDLKTGFIHTQNSTDQRPFLQILPSPVDYNKSDTSILPITTEFNGHKRTALAVFHSSENTTSKIEYDLETGILLDEHFSSIITIRGNPQIVNVADRLTDTNIINSDSQSIMNQSSTSIPKWVKTTAKSWSTGDIQDSEFIGAIQYLISKGVMHVPHGAQGTNSSQSIPTWIKHSTGMWSNDQITDNEFVQSIQWLISKGIIQVGN
ncbi:exported hypothetical protein [Nitrosotalea sinensis]|uniref:Secreted periplasmic Zn-dependent protease n=1 Tax=Nitrosotalea sinensis TaxID=1499975 RepID=A0A2H1EIU0_9ARCH|nr:hypothetical protein [Candidatus Nitrosotalea sinensis]SHO46994.1 exported hypothetical protein [Candidatus Nitrosotalea sinensis]